MKRRQLGVACVAMLAAAAQAAPAASSFSARLANWRRRALRSHVGLLVLGALAVGLPIALRARFSKPQEPSPWERETGRHAGGTPRSWPGSGAS